MFQKYLSNHSQHNIKLYTGEPAANTRNLRLVKLIGVSNKTIGVTLARVPLVNIKCDGYKVVNIYDGGWAKR